MNILDLFEQAKGNKAKKVASTNGGEYAAGCPRCGGTDRFRLWPKEPNSKNKGGSYWCRQCNIHGDGIQFARDFLDMTFSQACEAVGYTPQETTNNFKRPLELPVTEDFWSPEEPIFPDANFFSNMAELVFECHEFAKFRSKTLESQNIRCHGAGAFHIGYNPRDRSYSGAQLGLSVDEFESTSDWLKKRFKVPRGLTIPLYLDGYVAGLKVRRDDYGKPGDKGPKYHLVKGSRGINGIFHPSPIKGMPVIIVESELDAARIYQECWDLVIPISMGSATNKPDLRSFDLMEEARMIFIALDNDQAGQKAQTWWKTYYPEATFIQTPTGKDPGEYQEQGGDLREWIKAAYILGGELAEPETEPDISFSGIKYHQHDKYGEAIYEVKTTEVRKQPRKTYEQLIEPLRNVRYEIDPRKVEDEVLGLTTVRTQFLHLEKALLYLPAEERDTMRNELQEEAVRVRDKQKRLSQDEYSFI